MSRLGPLATLFAVIAAIPLVPAALGFLALTVGVALESSSITNWPSVYQLRLYSALYYQGHSKSVDSLACNPSVSPLNLNPNPLTAIKDNGQRTSPHPIDCILPVGYPTIIGWCPWVIQFLGACKSAAFRDHVLALPEFKEGLTQFMEDSCSVDERAAREILQRINNTSEYLPPTMRNPNCASPRSTVIYFINDRGNIASVMNRMGWLY
jgi:hypothetical protein